MKYAKCKRCGYIMKNVKYGWATLCYDCASIVEDKIEELENLDDELYLNWKKVRAIKEVKKRFEVTK